MIDWNKATLEDIRAISAIVRRVHDIDPTIDVLAAQMDLEACHTNGCPLDFARMADARAIDLMHDIYGINRHLDRDTGKLMDCFVPRFAATH